MASSTESTRKRARYSDPPQPYTLLPIHGEHKRAISSLSFAPTICKASTVRCATGSADGTAKIWDLPSSSLVPSNDTSHALKPLTLSGHARGINDVAWSASCQYLATASDDKTLRLWDVSSESTTGVTSGPSTGAAGDALVEFRGHLDFVFSAAFSPTLDLLASGSFDSTVKLWDVRCGSCVTTLPAHSDPVTSVDFNYDGTCIASASYDGLCRVWDVATGECLKTVVGEESSEGAAVGCVKFSPNGKYLLSGALDGNVRLWDLVGGKYSDENSKRRGKCLKTYCSHANTRFCTFSTFSTVNPLRPLVIAGSEDGKVSLYDLQSRTVRQTLDGHDGDAVLAVDAHDTLELIGTGGMTKDKTARFWGVAR